MAVPSIEEASPNGLAPDAAPAAAEAAKPN